MIRVGIICLRELRLWSPNVRYIAEHLASVGYRVTLFSPGSVPEAMLSQSNRVSYQVMPAPKGRGGSILTLLAGWLIPVLKGLGKFDVVIAFDNDAIAPGVVLKLFSPKTKLVWYCLELESPDQLSGTLSAKIAYCSAKMLARRSDIVIDSDLSRGRLRKVIYKIKSLMISIDNCMPAGVNLIESQRFDQLDNDRVKIGYAGMLGQYNGIPELVDAVKRIKHKAVLLIAGFGLTDINKKAIQEGVEAGAVKFLGTLGRNELASFYRSINIGAVFYPFNGNSYHRNIKYCTPNKLFEYMAFGLPVITSKNPTFKRWVLKEGWGVMVDPADINRMANQIEELCDNKMLRLQMSIKAIELYKTKYCIEKQIRPLLTFIGN
ncbi:MAG: glycosyltransferase [Candidatus Berkelbacteria bacterium]|nr:glycosyltransferase [Candidatus Berkelbacteria bacterium]